MNASKFGYLLILFIVIGFCTRIRTDGKSTDRFIFVKINEPSRLEIIRGEIQNISKHKEHKILRIHFQPVRGGATYWFGKIKTHETNGDKYPRLSLFENNVLKKKFSLNDILKLTPEIIDTMEVYPLYLLE